MCGISGIVNFNEKPVGKDQINLMKEIGKKAEQQSLAKYGLDFVTDTYLPEKLKEIGLGY